MATANACLRDEAYRFGGSLNTLLNPVKWDDLGFDVQNYFPTQFLIISGNGSPNPWGNSYQTARLIPHRTEELLGTLGQQFFSCEGKDRFAIAQSNVILFKALGSTAEQPLVYKIAAGLPAFSDKLMGKIRDFIKISAGQELLRAEMIRTAPLEEAPARLDAPMRPSPAEQVFREKHPPYMWGQYRHN